MITVNRPVSRDDSGVEGGSRPRTGSVTPCATAAAAPGTVSISLDSPASCGERRRRRRTRRRAAPA